MEGLLPLHSRTEPLTRGEVIAALAASGGRGRTPADSAWAARLRAEIRDELGLELGMETAGGGVVPVTARGGLRSRAEFDRGGRSRLRETLRVEAAADLTSYLSLFESFEIDTHGERDSDFKGKRWRDALTGRVDRAGILLGTERAGLMVGRSASRWGVGEPGGLSLSPISPPLDLVRARFDLGPARLASIAASLDPLDAGAAAPGSPPESRRFAAHRVSIRLPPSLGLGLTETIVYGGADREHEIAYLVPILSYYAEQWNGGEDDNVFWSIDGIWTPRAGLLIGGELLIDDFQYDLETEPHQTGWTVRGEYAPIALVRGVLLSLELTRIESFVYGHAEPRNRYLNEGVLLGHPLGPDADAIVAGGTWDLAENATLVLSVGKERHGSQRPDSPQDAVNPGDLGFPTRPVRSRVSVEIAGSWRPRVTRRLEASLAYVDDEVEGAGWSGRLAVTLRLDRGLLVSP